MASRKTAKRSKSPKAKSAKKVTTRGARKAAPKRAPAKKAAPKRAPAKKAAAKRAPAKKAARKLPRKSWPTVALPDLPEIDGYVRSLPPPIVPIVNRLRQIVRDAAPEAREFLDLTGPAYDANGLIARIETGNGTVRVTFDRGEHLEAPAGTLAGDGSTRVLEVSSFESLRENVLRTLVRQAVLLNLREPASGAV